MYDYSNNDDGHSNYGDSAFRDHQVRQYERQNVASYAPIYSEPVHANVASDSSAYCWQSCAARGYLYGCS